jgi:hypothetical protein
VLASSCDEGLNLGGVRLEAVSSPEHGSHHGRTTNRAYLEGYLGFVSEFLISRLAVHCLPKL